MGQPISRILSVALASLVTAGVTALSLGATAAILGTVHPAFDLFNHIQPILLTGLLLGLLCVPLLPRHWIWRQLVLAITATGLMGSALVVVPEAISSFTMHFPPVREGDKTYTLYTHNIFGKNYDMERLDAAIRQIDPDIITLQEYFVLQRNDLHPRLVPDYPHFIICKGGKRENIAIYAKMEFEALYPGTCGPRHVDRVSRIFARFTDPERGTFTVATTHLDWPVQVSKLNKGDNPAEGIDLAFARKRGQFADLAELLTGIGGPLILTADFNATAWSNSLRDFAHDAKLERHSRNILTYPTRFSLLGWRSTWPFLPLDHVMSRGGIVVHDIYGADSAGSDHRSLVTKFSVDPG